MAAALERLGIPLLLKLPIELVRMIRDLSDASEVWRFASVLDTAGLLSMDKDHRPLNLPLTSIRQWDRGRQPDLSSSSDSEPNVLVTVDWRGIRNVQRVPEGQVFHKGPSDSLAFLVNRSSNESLIAKFQVSLIIQTFPTTRQFELMTSTRMVCSG